MFNLAIRNRLYGSPTSLGVASQPAVGTKDNKTSGGVLAMCDTAVFKTQAVSLVLENLRATAGFALMRAAAVAERLQNNNFKSSQDGLATATEVLQAPSLSYLLTLQSLAPRARLYDINVPHATGLDAKGSLCLRERAVPVPLFARASRSYEVAFVTVNITLVTHAKGTAFIGRFDVQVYAVYEHVIYAGSTIAAHVKIAELRDAFTVIAVVFGTRTAKSLDSDISSHEVVVHATQSLQTLGDLCGSRSQRILDYLDSRRILPEYPTLACRRALPPYDSRPRRILDSRRMLLEGPVGPSSPVVLRPQDPVAAIEQLKVKVKYEPAKQAGGACRSIRSPKNNKENVSPRAAKNKKRSDSSKSTVDALPVPPLSIASASDFSISRFPKSNIVPPSTLSIASISDLSVNILAIIALAVSFALICIIVSVTRSITAKPKTAIKPTITNTVPPSDLSVSPLPKFSIVPPSCLSTVSHPHPRLIPDILAIVALVASFALTCIVVSVSVMTSIIAKPQTAIKAANTKTTNRRIVHLPDSHLLAYDPILPTALVSMKPGVRASKTPSAAPHGRSRKGNPPRRADPSTRRPRASLQDANAAPALGKPTAIPLPHTVSSSVFAPLPVHVSSTQATVDSILAGLDCDDDAGMTMWSSKPAAMPLPVHVEAARTSPTPTATSGLQATMDSILASVDCNDDPGMTMWSFKPTALHRARSPSEAPPTCDSSTNREEPGIEGADHSRAPRKSKKSRPPLRNALPSVQSSFARSTRARSYAF